MEPTHNLVCATVGPNYGLQDFMNLDGAHSGGPRRTHGVTWPERVLARPYQVRGPLEHVLFDRREEACDLTTLIGLTA